MAKKASPSRENPLIGRAVLDLRNELYDVWKKLCAASEIKPNSYTEFFPAFIQFAKTLLKIELEQLSHLTLAAVTAKVNGYWPDGRQEGRGLRIDIFMRIAPQPPTDRGKAAQRLIELRLSNPHFFDARNESCHIPTGIVQAAADTGIENDPQIFDTLRSLPQRWLGDWFFHMSGTYAMYGIPARDSKIAKMCRDFSFVMLDFPIWSDFFDQAFAALSIDAERILNERALREMEQRDVSHRLSQRTAKTARATGTGDNLLSGVAKSSESTRRKKRSEWLDRRCGEKGWTSDLDIAENGGPAYNTVNRYRSGRQSSQDRYVRGKLAKAFKCSFDDVPK